MSGLHHKDETPIPASIGSLDISRRIRQCARVIDWTGTPEDPSGYFKMRSFLTATAERLSALRVATADQMQAAANWVGLPSEWLGESAFALKATLAVPGLPVDLVDDMQSALDAIREGFRRVGTEPTF